MAPLGGAECGAARGWRRPHPRLRRPACVLPPPSPRACDAPEPPSALVRWRMRRACCATSAADLLALSAMLNILWCTRAPASVRRPISPTTAGRAGCGRVCNAGKPSGVWRCRARSPHSRTWR